MLPKRVPMGSLKKFQTIRSSRNIYTNVLFYYIDLKIEDSVTML